jgi:hypothetical protein
MKISGMEDFQWSVQEPTIQPPPLMMDRSGSNFELEPTHFEDHLAEPQFTLPPLPPTEYPAYPRKTPPPPPPPPPTQGFPPVSATAISQEQILSLIQEQVQETLEKMIQKSLPDLAERLIKEEIHRMLSET